MALSISSMAFAKVDRSWIVVLSKGNLESIQVFFKVSDIDILFTDKRQFLLGFKGIEGRIT